MDGLKGAIEPRGKSWLATKLSAFEMALTQALFQGSTHVSRMLEKLVSSPPIVMLTSVVLALSAETWPLRTSDVVAPEHATDVNEAGELLSAHRTG